MQTSNTFSLRFSLALLVVLAVIGGDFLVRELLHRSSPDKDGGANSSATVASRSLQLQRASADSEPDDGSSESGLVVLPELPAPPALLPASVLQQAQPLAAERAGVASNFAIEPQTEGRVRLGGHSLDSLLSQPTATTRQVSSVTLQLETDDATAGSSTTPEEAGRARLDSRETLALVPPLAAPATDTESTTIPTPGNPTIPDPIEPPHNASPINQERQRAIARELVKQELPGIPEDELSVLVSELETMPLNQMREHLRIWKQFSMSRPMWLNNPVPSPGPLAAPRGLSDSGSSRRLLQIPDVARESESLPVSEPWASDSLDLDLVDTARRIALRNLNHSNAIGFKAVRLVTLESTMSESTDVSIPELKIQRDLGQGPIVRTGRELDVAVEGPGFLVVERDGLRFFTRTGTLGRSRHGDVVLRVSGQDYALIPRIRLAPGQKLTLDRSGHMHLAPHAEPATSRSELTPETEVEQVSTGQRLRLALFPNPAGLVWDGCLALTTDESGEPIELGPGEKGAGHVLQGSLEQSNVDVLAESTRLQQLTLQLRILSNGIPDRAMPPSMVEQWEPLNTPSRR